MRKLRLTHRQRQILKSVLIDYWQRWHPNQIDALLGGLSRAGIGMSNDLVRAYEKYRCEYEESMDRWMNQIMIAAGVMPRDLWCVGEAATDQQLREIGVELGLPMPFPHGITDAQAKAILEVVQTIKPKRIKARMNPEQINDTRRLCNTIEGKK